MVFLRSPFIHEPQPVLHHGPVQLRPPLMDDYEAWARLRLISREFLIRWEPTWPADDLSRQSFRARVKRYIREAAEDNAYSFFVFDRAGTTLLGALTLSNVRRGVAQTASLGYWIGEPYAGRGYMTAAVRALVPHAFENLGLHRIEAACLPHNTASRALLEKSGFREEGYAAGYLKIDGRWQDHVLFAKLSSAG
ncbi:MAG: GNAT family N-acetyltransferase [Aestuariivirga sp.]